MHTSSPHAQATDASCGTFLLQDSRGNVGDNLMFWAAKGGYTSDIAQAELFTQEQAFAQHRSRISDVPWPAAYVRERARRVVDMQYLQASQALTWLARHGEDAFCVQDVAAGYVGNDIRLIGAAGKASRTTDLEQAKSFSLEALREAALRSDKLIAWPRGYLVAKSRQAAACSQAEGVQALGRLGLELLKPEREAAQRYRCHSCGCFLSQVNYYAGPCGRCGADNRP